MRLGRCAALLASGVASAGCMADEPKDSSHLTVLAVRAEPPTGVPGQAVTFELLHSDEVDPPAGSPRTLEIAWLGGCHNPAGGQYFDCYPGLRSAARLLAQRLLDTPAEVLARAGAGLGTGFSTTIPVDITARGYGVSFVFFAVCAGELTPAPDREDTVPLDCLSANGKSIDRAGFAVGFTTVYTVPGVANHNPVIDGIDFDGVPLDESGCAIDADCPSAGAERCHAPSARCLPVLEPCAASGCHRLTARIDPASAEPNPLGAAGTRETLELELVGPTIDATRRVRGDGSSFVDDPSFRMGGPPPGSAETLSVWLLVRDDRGGVAWTERTFLVDSPQ
jgi:hypothetical protein